MKDGTIISVSGPLVVADGMEDASIKDICYVGELGLLGEIIEMQGDVASIQVYEETSMVGPGEKVEVTGEPLSVELGPGMVTGMFDGTQRPLEGFVKETNSHFLERGLEIPALNREKLWKFTPSVKVGDVVEGGDLIGTVPETQVITHKVMLPPNYKGIIVDIASKGEYKVEDTIYTVKLDNGEEKAFSMLQRWPVRKPRPYSKKLDPVEPLVTGQRVIDSLFPVAKGGTAAVPGPFGAGKTVVQHQIAKWANVDLVVYVGCGERGNEMREVIEQFPELIDPNTGASIMERTILIANTSNMPVAAREASIYTGITIAEYFRDMGYSVAIMADSTSRWAEALREISGRLEEMPGDEGYPAYLGSRLAEYYERAGRVQVLGSEGKEGSITAISAVSPPGGDTSEPVTQNTMRVVKVYWALDASLSRQRHFPAINWLDSYSLYSDKITEVIGDKFEVDWKGMIKRVNNILQDESNLQEIVQLVGEESLSEEDRVKMLVARIIRSDFLQQNAYDDLDTYTSLEKQYKMLDTILHYYDECLQALKLGAYLSDVLQATSEIRNRLARMYQILEEELEEFDELKELITKTIYDLIQSGGESV